MSKILLCPESNLFLFRAQLLDLRRLSQDREATNPALQIVVDEPAKALRIRLRSLTSGSRVRRTDLEVPGAQGGGLAWPIKRQSTIDRLKVEVRAVS